MTRSKPNKISTVEIQPETPAPAVPEPPIPELPAKTLATVLGVSDETHQIALVESMMAELIGRRQLRQVFVNLSYKPNDDRLGMMFSQDATFDEVLAVLDMAQQRVIEARLKAKEAAEARSQTPPTEEPPHEH